MRTEAKGCEKPAGMPDVERCLAIAHALRAEAVHRTLHRALDRLFWRLWGATGGAVDADASVDRIPANRRAGERKLSAAGQRRSACRYPDG